MVRLIYLDKGDGDNWINLMRDGGSWRNLMRKIVRLTHLNEGDSEADSTERGKW